MDELTEIDRICQEWVARILNADPDELISVLLGEPTPQFQFPPPPEPEANNLPQTYDEGHEWCTVLGGDALEPNSQVTTAPQFGHQDGVDVWPGNFQAIPPSTSPHRQPILQCATALKRKHVNEQDDEDQPHAKRPLTAFMPFSEEQRPKVKAECNVRCSAVLDLILDQRWKSQSEEEQARYEEAQTELISPVVPNEPQVLMPTEELESEPFTAQTMQVQPLLSPSDVALTVRDEPVTPEVEETGQSDIQINLPSPPIPPTFHRTSLARQVIELVEAEFYTEEMGLLQPPQSHFDTDFPMFDSSEPGFHYAFWPDTDI